MHRRVCVRALVTVAMVMMTRHVYALPAQAAAPAVEAYLERYGYQGELSSDPDMADITDPAERREMAVMKFQMMAGLEVTGNLTEETLVWMNKTRCGVIDPVTVRDVRGRGQGQGQEHGQGQGLGRSRGRKKRYTAQGSTWADLQLTYKIINFSPDLGVEQQRQEVARAFKLWSDVTPLTFREVTRGRYDIEMAYKTGDHGDGYPFDGPSGTLAHAFFPISGGDIHMDEDEDFTAFSPTGHNLFQILAHEIGHSLGLQHSDVNTAVMRPFSHPYRAEFPLDPDDIAGIQVLYGAAPATTTTTTQPGATTSTTAAPPSTTPTVVTGPCLDGRFDTVTSLQDGAGAVSTLMFRRDMYARLSSVGVAEGAPVRYVTDDFPDLPIDLDAALYIAYSGRTYFFRSARCWLYVSGRLAEGYPTDIETEFPGVPVDLDCAFVWAKDNGTYFIMGGEYYLYDWGARRLAEGYPRPLTDFGVPSSVDAAFQWQNGRNYFFSGYRYYRIHATERRVDDGYPLLSRNWLSCDNRSVSVDVSGAGGALYKPLADIHALLTLVCCLGVIFVIRPGGISNN